MSSGAPIRVSSRWPPTQSGRARACSSDRTPPKRDREVNWATVLLGMAAAAMLVGTISYGVARFLNGQPVQHLFQISRDESSARVEPQSAQIPTSHSSTPEPVPQSTSPAPLASTATEPKQPDVIVAPTEPADGRTADASPSPSPVSTPRTEVVASEPTASPVSQSAGPKPPSRRRRPRQHGAGDRKASAIAADRPPSLPPSRPPLSGGRLVLPPPAPTVAHGVRHRFVHSSSPQGADRRGARVARYRHQRLQSSASAPVSSPAPASSSPVSSSPARPAPERLPRRHRHAHPPSRALKIRRRYVLFSLATKRPTTGSTRVQPAPSGHGSIKPRSTGRSAACSRKGLRSVCATSQ